jgi:hypothetical protein
MTNVQLTARNASAVDLVNILQEQQAEKLDVVAPAAKFRSRGGLIQVSNTVAQITEDGVTGGAGFYQPTEIFDRGLADKLGIGQTYMRKMRDAGRTDLIDGNVNGWLHGRTKDGGQTVVHAPDDRNFMLRLFRGDATEDKPGVARALLSDRYALSMDNLDILTAVNAGIQQAGVQPVVRVTDLSEQRMRVRFEFPDVNTTSEALLGGYKSPFEGGRVSRAGRIDWEALRRQYGAHHIFNETDAPVLFFGFDLTNSETGGGAYQLIPFIMMVRCTNGWTMPKQGVRKIHRGALLSEGLVSPSIETVRLAGKLVTSETKDTVQAWLKDGYLQNLVSGLEGKAVTPVVSATEVVPAVCQSLGFTEDERKGVLDLFILSGQPTAGGVAQAVSAYAQTVDDPDRAFEIENATVPALEAAAKAAA